MKISYRKNPIIEKVEKKSLGIFEVDDRNIDDINRIYPEINDVFSKYSDKFNSNIKIVTEPFYNAILSSKKRLAIPEILNNHILESGMFILKNMTTCFSIFKISGETHIVMFEFIDNEIDHYVNTITQTFWISDNIYDTDLKRYNISSKISSSDLRRGWLFLIQNFIKYAEIETKFLSPKSKSKDIKCKYINETKSNIEILDSKWFTTLVKSDAFKVSGHFRLQPCGFEMKERKLIWISDFIKTGYTAPARKIKEYSE